MKKILRLVLTGALIFGGCSGPNIEKITDLTGDGIPDVLLDINNGGAKYLFVGQTDGKFIRSKLTTAMNKVEYFLTNDEKTAYFFDGQYYRASPKQE